MTLALSNVTKLTAYYQIEVIKLREITRESWVLYLRGTGNQGQLEASWLGLA